MFYFGSVEDQATMYWEQALGQLGPLMPKAPLDELSMQDLRHALAYARMAYEAAETDGAPASTLNLLMERHDAVFEALAAVDDGFRDRVLGKAFGKQPVWLGGYDPENIAKYKALAGGSAN